MAADNMRYCPNCEAKMFPNARVCDTCHLPVALAANSVPLAVQYGALRQSMVVLGRLANSEADIAGMIELAEGGEIWNGLSV